MQENTVNTMRNCTAVRTKAVNYYVPVANELVLQVSISFINGETEVTCRKIKNNRVIEDEPQFLDLPVF